MENATHWCLREGVSARFVRNPMGKAAFQAMEIQVSQEYQVLYSNRKPN
jgi:hypothetical protein